MNDVAFWDVVALAVDALSPTDLLVLQRLVDGFTFEEISVELGVTKNRAWQRMKRIRRRIFGMIRNESEG